MSHEKVKILFKKHWESVRPLDGLVVPAGGLCTKAIVFLQRLQVLLPTCSPLLRFLLSLLSVPLLGKKNSEKVFRIWTYFWKKKSSGLPSTDAGKDRAQNEALEWCHPNVGEANGSDGGQDLSSQSGVLELVQKHQNIHELLWRKRLADLWHEETQTLTVTTWLKM